MNLVVDHNLILVDYSLKKEASHSHFENSERKFVVVDCIVKLMEMVGVLWIDMFGTLSVVLIAHISNQ